MPGLLNQPEELHSPNCVSLMPYLEGQPKPCTRVVVTDKAFEVKNLDDVIT